MEQSVIIVAGGSGLRMKTEVPKQFLLLAGKPVLMHTIQRFYNYSSSVNIVVVLPKTEIFRWAELCSAHNFTIKHKVVEGGETRFHSVKNGLAVLGNTGLIAVHDGVRPLVSKQTIHNCFAEAVNSKAVIPVITPVDSVRQLNGKGSIVVDRNSVRMVQTPQVFNADILQKAYMVDYVPDFTDDASVVEKQGHVIKLVEGNTENYKITAPADLLIAETLFQFVI